MGFSVVKLLDTPIVLQIGNLNPTGVYDNGTAYSIGDSVSYLGSSYVAMQTTTGNLPTDTVYWQLLASGMSSDLSLELKWIEGFGETYRENTYDGGGAVTNLDIYTDNTKITQLFSDTYTYNIAGDIITSVTVRIPDGATLTKTFNYDGFGVFLNSERVLS